MAVDKASIAVAPGTTAHNQSLLVYRDRTSLTIPAEVIFARIAHGMQRISTKAVLGVAVPGMLKGCRNLRLPRTLQW